MAEKQRFIRKNGKIIPVGPKKNDGRKDKSTQVKGFSKKTRRNIESVSAIGGAFAGAKMGKSLVEKFVGGTAGLIAGTLIGSGVGRTKWAKKKKGETDKQLAKRVGSSV